MIKKENRLYYFIALSFFLFPIVDSVNGYLILSGLQSEGSAGTFGQLFKSFFVMIGAIFVKSVRQVNIFISLIVYIYLLEFLGFSLHHNFSFFAIGVSHSLKLTFPLMLYFLLNEACKSYGLNRIVKIFIFSGFLYSFILLLAYAVGIGFNTYDEGAFGFKGPFASGNGLSLFLGSISLIALHYFKVMRIRLYLYISFLIIISSLIIGTKGSIIFLAAYAFLILIQIENRHLPLVMIVSTMFVLYFNQEIIEVFNVVFDVIVARFNSSNGIFEFLASSRDSYVIDAFTGLRLDGLFSLRLIFGMGSIISFMNPAEVDAFDTLETDFFDVFFFYGFVGIFFYLLLFLSAMYRIFYFRKYFIGFVFALVFAYSALAGHVLFNSMSVVSLVLAFVIIKNKAN
jgi:hypothetical protein